jgi:hypothetical protein
MSCAQTEHYAGLAVSNVIGPSYTLRHNRWMAVADAGWLTGFKGIYASVGGMYEVINMDKVLKLLKFFGKNVPDSGDDMQLSMGLGLFAQDYWNASAREARWANELGYAAPFGLHVLSEYRIYPEALQHWSFALRYRGPIYFTTKEYDHVISNKNKAVMMAALLQIVVQHKF